MAESTEKPQIRYLNTDLYLVAPLSLTPLTDELEQHRASGWLDSGEDGHWYANLNADAEENVEPETDLRAMLAAIESLSASSRVIWEACSVREFDIGYDCGDEPWAFTQRISCETLQRIAALGATLKITIYPHLADDDPRVHHAQPTEDEAGDNPGPQQL